MGTKSRAVFAAVLVGWAAPAGAAIPDEGGVIYGCYQQHHDAKENQGAVRLVSGPEACSKTEIPLTWNEEGTEGPKGADGAPGPKGEDGKPGAEGPMGPQGFPGLSVESDALPEGDEACPLGGVLLFVGDDMQTVCNGLSGKEGPQGEAGPKGEPGVKGEAGPPGTKGEAGPAGPAGPAGGGRVLRWGTIPGGCTAIAGWDAFPSLNLTGPPITVDAPGVVVVHFNGVAQGDEFPANGQSADVYPFLNNPRTPYGSNGAPPAISGATRGRGGYDVEAVSESRRDTFAAHGTFHFREAATTRLDFQVLARSGRACVGAIDFYVAWYPEAPAWVAPVPATDRSDLWFVATSIGATSREFLSLSNDSSDPFPFEPVVEVTGDAAADFIVDPGPLGLLRPGESVGLGVTFAPTDFGLRTGELRISVGSHTTVVRLEGLATF